VYWYKVSDLPCFCKVHYRANIYKILSLAYCELHIALAALVLRVFPMMKLYETTADDVKFHRDVFVSFPKSTSKGVRVIVE
jgi:hypothetical protein